MAATATGKGAYEDRVRVAKRRPIVKPESMRSRGKLQAPIPTPIESALEMPDAPQSRSTLPPSLELIPNPNQNRPNRIELNVRVVAHTIWLRDESRLDEHRNVAREADPEIDAEVQPEPISSFVPRYAVERFEPGAYIEVGSNEQVVVVDEVFGGVSRLQGQTQLDEIEVDLGDRTFRITHESTDPEHLVEEVVGFGFQVEPAVGVEMRLLGAARIGNSKPLFASAKRHDVQ